MKKFLVLILVVTLLAIPLTNASAGGFDEFGYNDVAGIFNGPADGVDNVLDGKVWGNPTYAIDRLIMKWNAAWDACNAHGYNDPVYCAGAWTSNEWNGMVPGGSGEVWHYKIIWVGSDGANSEYWQPGGYPIWGNYEVIMDQGMSDSVHYWLAHGISTGYGN